jgi:polysaccharide chain length determinant protein (PEP-CTERM system associated)
MQMDDQAISLKRFLGAIGRHFWLFTLVSVATFSVLAALAYSLPPVYRSTGTILIEQQGLPSDLVQSTVSSNAEERIAVVRQRVMAEANIIRIMDEHGLYPDLRKPTDETAAIARFKENVTVETQTAEVIDPRTARPASVTISFAISFDADTPGTAQAVASELVEAFLAENQKERQEVTKEATRFLEDESERLAAEITKLEAEFAAFKTEAGDSLPERMSSNLDALQRTRDRLGEINQSLRGLTESNILLDAELARTQPYLTSSSVGPGGERVLPPAEQLKSLESQAVALSARYSAAHPDRIRVEHELRALRQAIQDGSVQTSPADADNPAYVQLRARIIANETEMDALKKTRTEVESQIAGYERLISAGPGVEQRYLAMTRDYESAVERYRDVRSKLMQARMAESLETESKGERFTLVNAPRLSDTPVKPNRTAMIFLGFVLGIGTGLGSVLVRQAFDHGLYGARAVAAITGYTPLAVIPFIETRRDRHERRRRLYSVLGLFVAIVAFLILGYFALGQ